MKIPKPHPLSVTVVVIFFSMWFIGAGCKTGPEQQLLSISNGHVLLVDTAMIGWSTYARAGKVGADDIRKVKSVYGIYYKAAQAEKAAWVSYVSSRDLEGVRRAEKILLDMRQPLLDLLLELDATGKTFGDLADREAETRKGEVTIEDVEWAFTFLKPYSAYNVPEPVGGDQ